LTVVTGLAKLRGTVMSTTTRRFGFFGFYFFAEVRPAR
jgi:hypothetical protein